MPKAANRCSTAARSSTGKTRRPMAAIGVAAVRTQVMRNKRVTMVWQWAIVTSANGETSTPIVFDTKANAKGAVIKYTNDYLDAGFDVTARWEDQTGATQEVVYSVNAENESIVVSEKRVGGRPDVDGNPLPGPRCIDLPWSAKAGQPGNTSLVRRRKTLSGAPADEVSAREAARTAKRDAKKAERDAKRGKKPAPKREPKVEREPKAKREPKAPKTERTPKAPKTPKEPKAPKTPRGKREPAPPAVAPPPKPPRESKPPKAERAPRTPRGSKAPEAAESEAAQIAAIQSDFLASVKGLFGPSASHTGRSSSSPYHYRGR